MIRLRRFVEAIPLLEALVEARPDDERCWFNLAVAHQALGHLGAARAAWDRVLELRPADVETLVHRGEVLLDLHEWSLAAADFGAALKLDPDGTDCTLNLALAWQRMGRRGEARALLLDLLGRRPRNVPALRRLVDICREELDVNPADQAARRDLLSFGRRLVEIIPDEPGVRELLERVEGR
jgi:tetratricopeptide (TPR) repeat protein